MSTASLTWAYKRHLLLRPTLSTAGDTYYGFRIPKPPPAEEGETPPGRICWGTVGELPSPSPLPTVDFVVKFPDEKWTEKQRDTEEVRIENPDDPEQHIEVDRAKESTFEKREAKDGATPGDGRNTSSTEPKGIQDYFADNPHWKVVDDGKSSGKATYVKVDYEGVSAAPGSSGG